MIADTGYRCCRCGKLDRWCNTNTTLTAGEEVCACPSVTYTCNASSNVYTVPVSKPVKPKKGNFRRVFGDTDKRLDKRFIGKKGSYHV